MVNDELSDNNITSVDSSHAAAEYDCSRLAEVNVFVEQEKDGLELQTNNLEIASKETGDILNTDDNEEDREVALEALSNMKKYKINNLCHLDIIDYGWKNV